MPDQPNFPAFPMNLKQLLNWRFSLVFFHRWIGIAVGLMFVIWTCSGIVLMYAGIPHYTAGEKLQHLPPLDLSKAAITPQEALAKVGGTPLRLLVSMQDGRPAYRINTGQVFGSWTLIFADTGAVMAPLGQDTVIYHLSKLYPAYTETMRYEDYLRQPDFFTHSPALQNRFPLHVVEMDWGSEFYVSEKTGDIVMHTTPWTALLGALGYNLHTLFFWRQQSWWTPLLLTLSWLGLVMTLLGIVLGIWRFSRKPVHLNEGEASHTPYTGWWKWHHYAGLLFGVVMLTWVVSGLISMSIFPSVSESFYNADQIKAGARTVQGFGAPLDLSTLSLEEMRTALETLNKEFPVKELELQVVNEKPYYLAYRAPTDDELANWQSRSAMDFMTPTLEWEHRYIAANDTEAKAFSEFNEADLLQMAARAMPNQQFTELRWLTETDDYYYHTLDSFDLGLPRTVRTLPVLRLKYADTQHTWLYLSPSHAQLLKAEASDRANRWGYYGLHGFDFAMLYRNRPLWDILVLLLLLGCVAMSVTVLSPAYYRLKRHYFRLLSLFAED